MTYFLLVRVTDVHITFLETSFNAVSKAIETTKPKSLKEKVDFFAGPKTKLQILNLL
uniref:hypothetical protein n=1 Tax=Flavobacterium sp. TaxID=239 RepID=UPI0040479B9B